LLREVNKCTISSHIKIAIDLLNGLELSLKQVLPKNVFLFSNTEYSRIDLPNVSFPKEGFGFFGWICIEEFCEEPMSLWNIAREGQSLCLYINNFRLIYTIETRKEQYLSFVLSEELEKDKWYFVELYHLSKNVPSGNCIVLL